MNKILYSLMVSFSLSMVPSDLVAQMLPADTSLSGIYNFVKSATGAERMEEMTELFLLKSASQPDRRGDQCCKFVSVAYASEGNLEVSGMKVYPFRKNSSRIKQNIPG